MLKIQRYAATDKAIWNAWVLASKNATFLHDRGFMDYHLDRFSDHSLLCFKDDKLVAIFPATEHGDEIRSHGGLTYGGVLSDSKMSTVLMLDVIEAIASYYSALGKTSLLYKVIPHIYHSQPSEEDIYALFRLGGTLARVDNSTAINQSARIGLSKGKKCGISKAKKSSVYCSEVQNYEDFFSMLSRVLSDKHDAKPTHSLEELQLLHSRFPKNIRLHAAYENNEMVAGALMFITDRVAHSQYLAASDRGRDIGALDFLLHSLIAEEYADLPYFDFGISNERGGMILNEGLCRQKEMFGGRSIAHLFFTLKL